jgi:hypothetical protein
MQNVIKLAKSLPLFGLAAAMALAVQTAPAVAGTPFDGIWSVQVSSQECSDLRVPIQVAGGAVSYAGSFGAQADGRVGPDGRLNISFSYKRDVVTAQGSLNGSRGFGSWFSPTMNCSGSWVASKERSFAQRGR